MRDSHKESLGPVYGYLPFDLTYTHTGRLSSTPFRIDLYHSEDGSRHQPFQHVGLRPQRCSEEVRSRTVRACADRRGSCLFRHESHEAATEEDGHPSHPFPRVALSVELPRSVCLVVMLLCTNANDSSAQTSAMLVWLVWKPISICAAYSTM
jgi:hypothetical protein